MCGIAGILNRDSTPDISVLNAMSRKLAHRGPDDKGVFVENACGLVHRRLSVIDPEHGTQPMHDAENRYVIVFNGEIYNYVELRNTLSVHGYSFATNSDTEVLLYAFIHYGPECLEHLNGMFAFAVYDRKEKVTFLARDHFGIKPLYMVEFPNGFAFASEIKALFAHPEITPHANRGALHEYMTFQFCLDDRTLFQDIRKIPPASYALVRDGRITRQKKYWDLDFTVATGTSENRFLEQLRFLLEDSVRLQLRSDVPVGTYLSGGIDSSTVTTLAARLHDSPLSTFTGGFHEEGSYDESSYARLVAQHTGARHFECFPTPSDFVNTIEELVMFMDEPAAGPGVFPQYCVSKLAGEHVKVILGGQGGDEIFGGYARYLIAYLEQCLKSAILEQQEEGRFVATLDTIIPNLPLLREYLPLLKSFWSEGTFDPMDQRYFKLVNRLENARFLLTDDFLAEYDYERVFGTFQGLFNSPDTLSYINKMTHFDLSTLLPALLQVEDRMSMAASIESRVPLLDYRIADLVATMPPALKFGGGKTKKVLIDAVAGDLPSEIAKRKDKMGFPVPFTEWVRKEPVRSFVLDILTSQRVSERGIFSPSEIERHVGRERPFGRALWGALNLELWFRSYID